MTISHQALQMSDSAAVFVTFDGKHKQENKCLSSTTNIVSEPHEPGIEEDQHFNRKPSLQPDEK